jgi:hypothetical protein
MQCVRLLLALLAVAAALMATPTVWAAGTVVTRAPFSSSQFNQCAAGEAIEITGTLLAISRSVDEQTVFQFDVAGAKAVAPSTGAEYMVLTRSGGASYTDPDGSPSVLTVVQHLRFVRIGEDKSFPFGDDFDLRVLFHITINPDGTVTTVVSSSELTCV